MRILYLTIFLLYSNFSITQINLKQLPSQSKQIHYYKITTNEAEQFVKQDSIPLILLEHQTPTIISTTFLDEQTDTLPTGFYVEVFIREGEIHASIISKTNLIVYPLPNQQKHFFELRTKQGHLITNATIYANNKKLNQVNSSNLYVLTGKKLKEDDEVFIKAYSHNDTCFTGFTFEGKEHRYKYKKRFKQTQFGKILLYVPNTIKNIFSNQKGRYRKKIFSSYVVFNKPKYKLQDTVNVKVYAFTKKLNTYNKPLDVELQYYYKGNYKKQFLSTITPVSKGAFIYKFHLSDTLYNNINYDLMFFEKNTKRIVAQKKISIEDYILNETTNYNFKINKEDFYKNDSIVCTLEAKDANNLYLLDATAQVVIEKTNITLFEKDSIYSSDTVYNKIIDLNKSSSTIHTIHTNNLIQANSSYEVSCIFKNSNNELHKKVENINYQIWSKTVKSFVVNDTIYANYFVNGIDVPIDAILDIESNNDATLAYNIKLPFKIKIDGYYTDYSFKVYNNDTLIASSKTIIPKENLIQFSYNNSNDSIGFALYNSQKLPITYFVFYGNKVIGSGKSNESVITWKQVVGNKNKLYILKYYYLWDGKQIEKQENLAILHKLLHIDVKHKTTIYPGEKDSISLTVKNFNNKPVNKANITALSYNTQFESQNSVKDPPYYNKYKTRKQANKGIFDDEDDDVLVYNKIQLGKYPNYIKKFNVDTMLFYKIHFPNESKLMYATPIKSFVPQVAIHCVKNGLPQKIFLIYLNLKLVYNSIVTANTPYSFESNTTHTQISVRLFDQQITIDSIYLQPYYKHEFIIDLDNLPSNAIINQRPKYYTKEELKLIEKTTLQLHPSMSNAFIWDSPKNANTFITNSNDRIFVGPFTASDSLQFYQPNRFDKRFLFEPGYVTQISQSTIRLEQKSIFNYYYSDTNWLSKPLKHYFKLGDTLVCNPTIKYEIPPHEPIIYNNKKKHEDIFTPKKYNKGSVDFFAENNFKNKYYLLYKDIVDTNCIVLNTYNNKINNLDTGTYKLTLITKDWYSYTTIIKITPNKTLHLKLNANKLKKDSLFIEETIKKLFLPSEPIANELKKETKPLPNKSETIDLFFGNSKMQGKVIDAVGKLPINGAIIMIKGRKTGTVTNEKGEFFLPNLPIGKYEIICSAIGYSTESKSIFVDESYSKEIEFKLYQDNKNLEEVVVTGYGTKIKKSLTVSIATVRENSLFTDNLQGKVTGVMITNTPEQKISIRGISSIKSNSEALYIVDGISVEKLPNENEIKTIEVLKDAAATAIYGSRAINGVIIVTTNKNIKAVRNYFKDYGFWVPNILTNKDGKASIEVSYPDNITSWQNYFIAFDKRGRAGKKSTFVKSFKPIMAQLSTPQFLIEGDKSFLVAKSLNYTSLNFDITSNFKTGNTPTPITKKYNLKSNESFVDYLPINSNGVDSVSATFSLLTNSGFEDGEERKIPVLKKGIEETNGVFAQLNNDTSFALQAKENSDYSELYVTNNGIDIWLKELDWLKKYPHYCMEQTTSKIVGLYNEKKIKQTLNLPFKDDDLLNKLIDKLLKSQNFNGGWSWWGNDKTDTKVSNYIMQTLVSLKDDKLIDLAVRNGLLYLQNNLDSNNKELYLAQLYTLSLCNHETNYIQLLKHINFENIQSTHQKWLYVGILQNIKEPFKHYVDSLIVKSKKNVLGGIYWGDNTNLWQNNTIATTTLAYKILEKADNYNYTIDAITKYFLSLKRDQLYFNTVEVATITSTILPRLLTQNKNFINKSIIQISGDTSLTINSFPFYQKISNKVNNIKVTKLGGGLTYFTFYNKYFNNNPVKNDSIFQVNTSFKNQQNQTVTNLKTGETYFIHVSINAIKKAEYVQIEVPIPAGCIVTQNSNQHPHHISFYKNKIVFFVSELNEGIHNFSFKLEARYSGNYNLNPAKAELMYFPTFYGNNQVKEIEIFK